MIEGGTVRLTEFAHATVVAHSGAHDCENIVAGFVIDRHMLACTILYTLSGGRGADDQPLDFDELMEATEIGFDDESLFDGIRVGKRELADLLSATVDPDTPLTDLLKRPYYWNRLEIIEFLGEEVGSMLDPAATAQSSAQQYAFISDLEAHADKEVAVSTVLHCARIHMIREPLP